MSSTTCAYMTAPSSPNDYSRSNSMEFYYSAPTSPQRKAGYATVNDQPGSNLDEFEFETSKRWFSGQLHFDSPSLGGDRGHEATMQKHRERADSLPAMAFADELFANGLVMPLKPPPRLLHCDSADFNSFSQKSPVSSPKSPRRVYKIPFAYKNLWNDDFDPFMVALEKVREEKRGRNSHHKRSRSYSPFRAISRSCSNIDSARYCYDQELPKGNSSPMQEPMQVPPPSHSGPLDFKGSAYARWVRDQAKQGLSPKNSRPFLFGQRVRPLKIEVDVPTSPKGKHVTEKPGTVEKSKVQKLKGFLLRYYASFGRVNSGTSKQIKTSSDERKPSYFSRLSFKFKGNANTNGKRKVPAADGIKMAVVEYKQPSIGLCLSSRVKSLGSGSPAIDQCSA